MRTPAIPPIRARLVPRARHLPAATGLSRSAAAFHVPPFSFRSFAQYSSRFLISRSKPRSSGS